MILTLSVLLILPFILEAGTRIGFKRPAEKRHMLFYLLVPLTSLFVYASLAALLGHPVITCLGWLMVYGGLTVVSNVKNRVLGEPLVAHDLETARHLFIYPEFYIDYVGAGRVIAVFGGFALAILLAIAFETPFMAAQEFLPVLPAWAAGLILWSVLLYVLARGLSKLLSCKRAQSLGITFDINTDVARFGLFPLMPLYGILLLDPARNPALEVKRKALHHKGLQPDLIAMQAESYFDIDRLYRKLEGHQDHVWHELKALRDAGAITGHLDVPAWGASTMQSEFAFLTGTRNGDLLIDSINPYQRAAYTGVETLATRLKHAGYHTVCIHPAKKEFFRRSTVIPKLGFDEFIGIEAFEGADRFGPYISDTALGDVIEATIQAHKAKSEKPLFLFTITIESHGPWDEGRLSAWIDEDAITRADPTHDRSFALYRQHMDNVLDLFERLGPEANLDANDRPRALALYGDHMPAFNPLFSKHDFDSHDVDYILWTSSRPADARGDLAVHDLGDALLNLAGFD